eukprot:4717409-Amphidinium_carterae.1
MAAPSMTGCRCRSPGASMSMPRAGGSVVMRPYNAVPRAQAQVQRRDARASSVTPEPEKVLHVAHGARHTARRAQNLWGQKVRVRAPPTQAAREGTVPQLSAKLVSTSPRSNQRTTLPNSVARFSTVAGSPPVSFRSEEGALDDPFARKLADLLRAPTGDFCQKASSNLPKDVLQNLVLLAEQAITMGIDYATLGLGWRHPNSRA